MCFLVNLFFLINFLHEAAHNVFELVACAVAMRKNEQ